MHSIWRSIIAMEYSNIGNLDSPNVKACIYLAYQHRNQRSLVVLVKFYSQVVFGQRYEWLTAMNTCSIRVYSTRIQ